MKKKKVENLKKIIYISFRVIILALFILTIIFAIIDKENRGRNIFIALQSGFFLILSFVPSIIERGFKYEIPDFLELAYLFFCIAHTMLGEVGNFYATISWWDDMLHTISGILIAICGYSLVKILNKSAKGFTASPLFVAIFVICLAVTVGVLWEIIEFTVDVVTSGNMQRYKDSITGEPFVGQQALVDTMGDLIEALIGAILVVTIGYIDMVRKKDWFKKLSINKIEEKENKAHMEGEEL